MKTLNDFLSFQLFVYHEYELTIFSLLVIVLVFVLARLGLWSLGMVLNRNLSKRTQGDAGRRHALMQIAKYVVYTLAVLFSLQSVGLNLSLILAGSAALLVGIGFGLQNIFNDFLSGIIILFDGSIQVHDVVQVGELIGKVTHIGLRATTVYTRDGISVIVPNAKFTLENVVNWSHTHESARFNVQVGVAYGSDVEQVIRTMGKAVQDHPKIEQDPPPKVRFTDFGDSALLFEVLFWTRDTFSVEFTKSDIRIAIDKGFREAKIQIPFPQRDLHIISDKRAVPFSS